MSGPNQVERQFGGDVLAWAELDTANTNLDGTGTIVELLDAPTHNAFITELHAVATVATTDGSIRYFLHDGTAWRFRWLRPITGTAVTDPAEDVFVIPGGLRLPVGWKIGAATEISEDFNVFVEGLKYE